MGTLSTAKSATAAAAAYEALDPLPQAILDCCALFSEPVDSAVLASCLRQGGIVNAEADALDAVEDGLQRLQRSGLLSAKREIPAHLLEPLTRHAARRKQFASLAAAVLCCADKSDKSIFSGIKLNSFARLRVAVHCRDEELFDSALLQCLQDMKQGDEDPVVRICWYPFDPEWFSALPLKMRFYAVSGRVMRAVGGLENADQLLGYLHNAFNDREIPAAARESFVYYLCVLLLLKGEMNSVRDLLADTGEDLKLPGIAGWVAYLDGDAGRAVSLFEKDIEPLQELNEDEYAYFTGPEGIFFILALLKRNALESAGRIRSIVRAVARLQPHSPYLPAYEEFARVVDALRGRVDDPAGKTVRSAHASGGHCFADLAGTLVSWWLDGELDHRQGQAAASRAIQAAENGWLYLAREFFIIAERAGVCCQAVADMPASVATMEGALSFEEPWQRALKALGRSSRKPAKSRQPDSRLIWLVRPKPREMTIELLPRVQRFGMRGKWSAGRPVSLKRLQKGGLEYLSELDEKICSAIVASPGTSGGRSVAIDMDQALPHLVGHPYLFLEQDVLMPVEMFHGAPEIIVTDEGGCYCLRMTPFPDRTGLLVEQVSPTRFKIITTGADHLHVAEIVGPDGLRLPHAAKEELAATLEKLSGFLAVHSEFIDKSSTKGVSASSALYLQLSPYGNGLRVTMLVRPFGADGPSLSPGEGMRTLMAEVGGERLRVVRDLDDEERRARAVEALCPVLAGKEGSGREWVIEDVEDCLELLLDFQKLPHDVVVLWPEGRKIAVSPPVSARQLQLQVRKNRGWFELSGGLKVDDTLVLDMASLLAMARDSGSRFLPLSNGQYLALSNELRRQLQEIDSCVQERKNGLRIHPFASPVFSGVEQQGVTVDADRHWRRMLAEMQNIEEWLPEVPGTLRAELRDYQEAGFRWLARLARLGMGACLADDMGLGKTVQALALLLNRAADGPALVVAPTSVCENWRAEAARFAPTLKVLLFAEMHRRKVLEKLGAFDVLVVSYGLMQQEGEALAGREWSTVILDEAQAIKNIMTKRARAAMRLNGRFRLITTGTPIENHLGELWSLFQFINPGLLGPLDHFNRRFAVPVERNQDQAALRRLKKIIQPFILRRIKSQVLEELPPRTEILLHVAMGEQETAFYEALRREAVQKVRSTAIPSGRRHLLILAEITRLRQACCNSRLLVADSTVPSAKLALFGKLVDELLENRHKVLVFSQFVGHLRILREFLDAKGLRYCYLDGSTPRQVRKEQVDHFQAGGADMFLISLKAGGLGLNLTAADYVIHMDPWWNPAVEDQASDRAHRIGQTRPVTVYRLVTQHTIEEKIVKLHQEKKELADILLTGTDTGARLSADELLDLLQDR